MARKKTKKRRQRDVNSISKRRTLLPGRFRYKRNTRNLVVDDKRYFRPLMGDIALKDDGTSSRIIVSPKQKKRQTKSKLEFASPRRTVVCHRRKRRREQLFKMKIIGRGKGGPKIRRRDRDSDVGC